jgi:hypothetical protein
MTKRVWDRVGLVLVSIAFSAIAWATFLYAGEWVIPVTTTLMLLGFAWEVSRLRWILREHGIDYSRRKRN